MLRVVLLGLLSVIFFILVLLSAYFIPISLERWSDNYGWRREQLSDEVVLLLNERNQLIRYEEATRFARLMDQQPSMEDISRNLNEYIFKAFGREYQPPSVRKAVNKKKSVWAILTNSLLLRNPMSTATDKILLLLRFPATLLCAFFATLICGSMALPLVFVTDRLAGFIFLRITIRNATVIKVKRLSALMATVIVTFLYLMGVLFLTALGPANPTLMGGIIDSVRKMLCMHEIVTIAETNPALMDLATRLLLISAFASFLFTLCRLYIAYAGDRSGAYRLKRRNQSSKPIHDKKND